MLGWSPHQGDWCSYKRDLRGCRGILCRLREEARRRICEATMRGQQPAAQKRSFIRARPGWPPDPGLSAPRTVSSTFLWQSHLWESCLCQPKLQGTHPRLGLDQHICYLCYGLMAPYRGSKGGKKLYSVLGLFVHSAPSTSEASYFIHQVCKEVTWHRKEEVDGPQRSLMYSLTG